MEKLKSQQGTSKGHFTRCANSLREALEKDPIDYDEIKKYKKSLILKFEVIKKRSEEIQDLITDDDEALKKEMADIEEQCEIYVELDTRAESLIEENNIDKSQQIQHRNSTMNYPRQRINLPVLELKKFDGECEEYQEFIENFNTSVHNNEELEPVEKFTYLKALLTGDAEALVASYSTTQATYKEALRILKDNFGREDLIIVSHISKLLTVNTISDHKDVKAMRNLLNFIMTKLRSLQALGVDVSNHSIFIAPIILSKLPIAVSVQWNRKKKKPDINALLDMVQMEVEGYEAAARVHDVFAEKEQGRVNTTVPTQRKSSSDQKIPTAAALHINAKKYCIMCKENSTHETDKCRTFKALHIKDRKQVCYEDFVCFLCLKKNHMVKRCPLRSKATCEVCKSQFF